MIEEKNLDEMNDVALKKPEKPVDKEDHEKTVIESCILPKYDNSDTKIVRSIVVDNIYNDGSDFIAVIKGAYRDKDLAPIDTEIRISRDLLKQVIYDIYLT